jgi:uncharacterized coiled-coil protein SlyX
MIEHVFDKAGQYKSVYAAELERLTLQGWQLVFCYQEAQQLGCSEQEPVLPATNNGYCPTTTVQRYKPVTVTLFVVRKPEESVLAELNVLLASARETLDERNKIIVERNEESIRLNKQLQSTKDNLKSIESSMTVVRDDRDRFRETVAKLEKDMVRIKTAIGERAYGEILKP